MNIYIFISLGSLLLYKMNKLGQGFGKFIKSRCWISPFWNGDSVFVLNTVDSCHPFNVILSVSVRRG